MSDAETAIRLSKNARPYPFPARCAFVITGAQHVCRKPHWHAAKVEKNLAATHFARVNRCAPVSANAQLRTYVKYRFTPGSARNADSAWCRRDLTVPSGTLVAAAISSRVR